MKNIFIFSVIVLLLWGVVCVSTPSFSAADISITTSGVEDIRFKPAYAMDNDFNTRWSSPFSDSHWLLIDLGEVKELAGLIVYWEEAYASSYDVMLSVDKKKWVQVFSTENSDGKSDEIYFIKRRHNNKNVEINRYLYKNRNIYQK